MRLLRQLNFFEVLAMPVALMAPTAGNGAQFSLRGNDSGNQGAADLRPVDGSASPASASASSG
jgi:hypothetical protein